MTDFTDITKVNSTLKECQDVEHDNRDRVRKAHNFIEAKDGQWEPEFIYKRQDKYRGTFDKVTPIINGIHGEIVKADFDARVRPAGGTATQELAKTYDGLVRNIETISNASHVYAQAARDMIVSGIGGWEIRVDWADGDSFDQDFLIKWIPSFEDRVWIDKNSTMQDASDANHAFIIDNISKEKYKKMFPEGSCMSVGNDRSADVYTHKAEGIEIGRILYKKPFTKKLVMMTDGSVYEDDEDFQAVVDELAEQGIEIAKNPDGSPKQRDKKTFKVYSRLFDGGGFLTPEQETVFSGIPIIPNYLNFAIREGKLIYKGNVEPLMDAQRSYNTFRSREIEDIALTPPEVIWATRDQLSNPSDLAAVEKMSVSQQRVYLYTKDADVPGPPVRDRAPVISPGLQQSIQNSLDDIQTTSARSPLMSGDTDGVLSGVAIEKLQNKGDSLTIQVFRSMEIAICRTVRLLVDGIPKLYDSTAQKRILNEDGSYELIELNKKTVDLDTGKTVTLNDLSQGKYDVTCSSGPSFKNRQQESVRALIELSNAVPGVGEASADILLNNVATPGVDLVAERIRRVQLQNGVIPDSQMTNEEREEIEKARAMAEQQPPEPTAEDKIAEAEIARVQAETEDVIIKGQLKQEELRIKEQESLLRAQTAAEKLQMEELQLMMKNQQMQLEQQNKLIEANIKGQAQVFETLNTQAQTLKTLREAMGVDTIVGASNTESYIQQAETITEQQEEIDRSL
jgi:hypothetical protein